MQIKLLSWKLHSLLVLIILSSCSTQEETVNNRDVEALNLSRLGWLDGMSQLGLTVQTGEGIDRELLTRVVLKCVARDAAFEYSGRSLDMSKQWMILAGHNIEGRIDREQLNDPFGLMGYYEKNPDQSPPLWAYAPEVIEDQESYQEFVSWFRERLEEETAIRRSAIESSPANRASEDETTP